MLIIISPAKTLGLQNTNFGAWKFRNSFCERKQTTGKHPQKSLMRKI
jgi:hypothetical protein